MTSLAISAGWRVRGGLGATPRRRSYLDAGWSGTNGYRGPCTSASSGCGC